MRLNAESLAATLADPHRDNYKFGWLQGSRKLLKEDSFWLQRLDLNQFEPMTLRQGTECSCNIELIDKSEVGSPSCTICEPFDSSALEIPQVFAGYTSAKGVCQNPAGGF